MDKIGIVILHYGSWTNTGECLDSIQDNWLKEIDAQIVLVINPQAGKKGNGKYTYHFKKKFPNISIIENNENIGFSKAVNLGLNKALKLCCSYVILVNNDTIFSPNLINDLVNCAKENPKAGLVSPKIYFAKGFEFHKERYKKEEIGKIIWYAGGIIDWKNIYAGHRGVDEVDSGQFDEIGETSFSTGCCMLITKEAIEKIGYLDKEYFLYFEDVDYSLRAKRAGFQVIYNPKAFLWHKNAASSGKPGSVLHQYYLTRNRLYFGFKYASFWTKKSLFFESLKMILKGGIQRRACFDYYFGRMGKGDL